MQFTPSLPNDLWEKRKAACLTAKIIINDIKNFFIIIRLAFKSVFHAGNLESNPHESEDFIFFELQLRKGLMITLQNCSGRLRNPQQRPNYNITTYLSFKNPL